jgi:mRNA interferase HigB
LLPIWEPDIKMQVMSKRKLREFWEHYPPAERPLSAWYKLVSKASWQTPADLKAAFGTNVDFVGDNRVIFDIGRNKYRLIVYVAYHPYYRVLVKFAGTHEAYDQIDPETAR